MPVMPDGPMAPVRLDDSRFGWRDTADQSATVPTLPRLLLVLHQGSIVLTSITPYNRYQNECPWLYKSQVLPGVFTFTLLWLFAHQHWRIKHIQTKGVGRHDGSTRSSKDRQTHNWIPHLTRTLCKGWSVGMRLGTHQIREYIYLRSNLWWLQENVFSYSRRVITAFTLPYPLLIAITFLCSHHRSQF